MARYTRLTNLRVTGGFDADASEQTAIADGGTAARTLADHFADSPSLKDFGAVGDGVTDDTAAVVAAEASTIQTFYVPEGTYATSLSQAALHKRYVGPGQIQTQTSKRGPYYSDVTAPPSSVSSHTSVTNAFDGDWSNSQFPVEHRITGATTLGQPTTSYTYVPEAFPHYTYLYNTSGYNHELDGNTGRTGACAYRVKLFQAGQGDLAAFNASAFVTGTKASSTHFLANPAVALFNGDLEAGADGTYLNAGEMILDDNGFDTAGIGWVINMNRSNATAAKFAMWCGHRVQSVGTQFVDAAMSVYGKITTGLDFVTSTGIQALVMKAGQRIYGNGTNSDAATATASATSPGTSWLGYDATLVGWETAVGSTRCLGVTETGIGIGLTPTVAVDVQRTGATDVIARLQGETGSVRYEMRKCSTDTTAPVLYSLKRRGTVALPTIVASGDGLFQLQARGHDGTQGQLAATVSVEVDGTPGAGDMPGRIILSTSPDGSVTPVERLRIDNAGNVGIGGSSFGGGVKVAFLANATTVPTTNPSGGGVLYVESGNLRYRGSSGTVTTLGVA